MVIRRPLYAAVLLSCVASGECNVGRVGAVQATVLGYWALALLPQARSARRQRKPTPSRSTSTRRRSCKLPDQVATIVIGNPLIADATLQSGGVLVVTGKGYGATNLLALDRGGQSS